jgi:hypothetical protein
MTTETTQSPQMSAILQRLHLLDTALLTQDPAMRGHVGEMHKLLISHEELVHLLSVDQISRLMRAQQLITNTVLVGSMTGKTGKASASKKSTGLNMGDL